MVLWDIAASSCWSHLILMTANYPLRWDPVPASCHGDITRASVNAGATARNHPDPELTGKTVQPCVGRHSLSLPVSSTPTLNLFSLKGPLYFLETHLGAFSLCLSEHLQPPADRQNGNCLFSQFSESSPAWSCQVPLQIKHALWLTFHISILDQIFLPMGSAPMCKIKIKANTQHSYSYSSFDEHGLWKA